MTPAWRQLAARSLAIAVAGLLVTASLSEALSAALGTRKAEPAPVAAKTCGDGKCDAAASETVITCAADCAGEKPVERCGDGHCQASANEDRISCPVDCESFVWRASCGDSKCEPDAGENCSSCDEDCGLCPRIASCGDRKCKASEGEDPISCPSDCVKRQPRPDPEAVRLGATRAADLLDRLRRSHDRLKRDAAKAEERHDQLLGSCLNDKAFIVSRIVARVSEAVGLIDKAVGQGNLPRARSLLDSLAAMDRRARRTNEEAEACTGGSGFGDSLVQAVDGTGNMRSANTNGGEGGGVPDPGTGSPTGSASGTVGAIAPNPMPNAMPGRPPDSSPML